MLKVIDSTSYKGISLVTDEYIPLAFRCEEKFGPPYLNWEMISDEGKGLVEVCVNGGSGEIYDVSVISINQFYCSFARNNFENKPIIDGIPICDVSLWETSKYIEENQPFITIIDEDSISVWLSDQHPVELFYKAGDLYFGVSKEGFLCLLHFKVSNSSIQIIIESTKYNKSYEANK